MAKKRRINYLVKSGLQLKYVAYTALLMVAIVLISSYLSYQTAYSALSSTLQSVYPQSHLQKLLQEVNMLFVGRMLLILPAIVLCVVLISHRIAGPIYRIRRTLKALARGEFGDPVVLRKRDELKDLANDVNELAAKYQGLIESQRTYVEFLEAEYKKHLDLNQQNEPSKELQHIGEIISELKGSLNAFS